MASYDFWEPWMPKVGQKVRVRVSAECRTVDSHQPFEKYLDHQPIGEVHRIVNEDDSYEGRHASTGHRYWVTHEFVPVPGKPFHGLYAGHFAAVELEPLL